MAKQLLKVAIRTVVDISVTQTQAKKIRRLAAECKPHDGSPEDLAIFIFECDPSAEPSNTQELEFLELIEE